MKASVTPVFIFVVITVATGTGVVTAKSGGESGSKSTPTTGSIDISLKATE